MIKACSRETSTQNFNVLNQNLDAPRNRARFVNTINKKFRISLDYYIIVSIILRNNHAFFESCSFGSKDSNNQAVLKCVYIYTLFLTEDNCLNNIWMIHKGWRTRI